MFWAKGEMGFEGGVWGRTVATQIRTAARIARMRCMIVSSKIL